MTHNRECKADLKVISVIFRMSKMHFIVPPEGNVLMLRLLSSGVKDTLPAVNLHTDIQLKVNVSFSCWATEAAVGRCARPALAEQLTHSRKA